MKRRLLFLSAFLLLTACRAAPAAEPTAAPTAVPLAPTSPPEPTAPPATAAADVTPGSPASPPALFDATWDDRSIYAAGLVDAGGDAGDPEVLPGAPVYHMAITIDEALRVVDGRQTVFYTNAEDVALEEVYFHLHPNLLDSAIDVTNVTVNGAAATTEIEGAKRSILRVPLAAPLPPGEMAVIDMTFQTRVATDIGRNYGVLASYEGILALAHFYPMLSVHDDTGWNTAEADIQGDLTYSDAGFYLVRVSAPAETVLVASGVETAREAAGDTQIVTYALGPARDFYLAAGDFVAVSDAVGATTINSYAPAELEQGAILALDVAAAALTDFDARVSPYPYTELDIVTTPTSALGIEYPGLIVGTLRMYDVEAQTQSGVPYAAILESTTAHEVAHQWFYNVVGNDQLDEPWLDESLGSYTTYRYYVTRYGQDAADQYFETFAGRWARVDKAEIPIGLPVAAYEGDEYSAIVYGRGPIFVRELEETMGREAFDAFLREYAAQQRWGISVTADFRTLAEQQCGCDLGPLFEEWVYE